MNTATTTIDNGQLTHRAIISPVSGAVIGTRCGTVLPKGSKYTRVADSTPVTHADCQDVPVIETWPTGRTAADEYTGGDEVYRTFLSNFEI